MCPHGYHHSGSMATPALGTRDVRLHIVWIALWSHQSAQTASSERCIVRKVNVPQGGSPPNPRECSNCTGSERNIQRITMCPHGYHHSGSMATPALGTRDVRLHIVWIALWSHQSAQTASSERCIVRKVNVPQGGSPPNPRECSNCTGSERNIQRITMCPHGYHHSGSMATPALGTRDVRLHIVWIALWSHQSAQTASSERCIVRKVNVPQGGSPPNPRECSNCTGSERNIQRITMCPHGYHHSGSMATPALGTRDVRLHIVWIALWSHQSAQTASSERCIVRKVNVPQGGSPLNPRECSNCTGSERNIQRITMCPHGYIYIYIYIYIYMLQANYVIRHFTKCLKFLVIS